MAKKLLIVESPAKAKTIGKYLGADFTVKSSVGHIRDLPKESGAIKIVDKGDGKWEFVPTYVVSKEKTKVVSELKTAVKGASAIYLASDPDREGEAIAWHLKEVLGSVAADRKFLRVTYNEITKSAVLRAVESPRDIDMPLVDAQQARRILDRIVGYKVSPLLWKNINCANNRSLSAGRVQSVALRLLVERQREIDAFKPTTYYLMGVESRKANDAKSFVSKLARLDGKKPEIDSKEMANNILLDLAGAELEVKEVKAQPKVRHALPPFTTSTLQQASSSMLGFSPGKTMKIAQDLYECGLITYMRTDSVNISDQARSAAKEFIISTYGEKYYPEKPNFFKSKADAQGAHEAIRPTEIARVPEKSALDAAELKLYDLIWRRFVASQMADAATTLKTILSVAKKPALTHEYLFSASATAIDFDGFLKLMKLSLKKKRADGEDDEDTDEVAYLPDVAVGDELEVIRWLSEEKQTKGPVHYSEASLIKALEENGVGRPSTYAATIETLKARDYAKTEKRKLVPQERGILVCDWLVKKLDSLFNVGYTAQMEEELDKIELHGKPMNQMLSEFYAKFLEDVKGCAEPPPDASKFDFVFGLLNQIKVWKPAKKVGNRIYDDKAFFESVRSQRQSGERPLSARQLEALVKMSVQYSDQIADCLEQLKNIGLVSNAAQPRKADPEAVKQCFEIAERIKNIADNKFYKSLHEQFDRGRWLSEKQFSFLAKMVYENAVELDDAAEVRSVLSKHIGEETEVQEQNPDIPKIFKLFEDVKKWREPAKRGKRVYDDEKFVKSLADQFAVRHILSLRQLAALKGLVSVYSSQITDVKKWAAELDIPIKDDADKSK